MSIERVDPPWRVRQQNDRRHLAKLLGAPKDFRFLCGVEWREGRDIECFLRYPPENLSGDKARAVAHTFRVACERRRQHVYVHDYDAVKAAVRRKLASGGRELILGEDL
jgi:hypothetical protein